MQSGVPSSALYIALTKACVIAPYEVAATLEKESAHRWLSVQPENDTTLPQSLISIATFRCKSSANFTISALAFRRLLRWEMSGFKIVDRGLLLAVAGALALAALARSLASETPKTFPNSPPCGP